MFYATADRHEARLLVLGDLSDGGFQSGLSRLGLGEQALEERRHWGCGQSCHLKAPWDRR